MAGVNPETVAVYHGDSKTRALERRMWTVEVVLRCAVCGLGVLAAALIGFDSQVRVFFSVEKKARFTDMKALVFLVIANGVAAGYSLVQGVRCIVSMIKGAVLLNKATAWVIFSCDQAMAYLTLAAVSAAMQAAMLGQFGQPELQWMKICNLYGKFCTQVGEGLAGAFLVCLCSVTVSTISAFNLFRMYGKSKANHNKSNNNTANW